MTDQGNSGRECQGQPLVGAPPISPALQRARAAAARFFAAVDRALAAQDEGRHHHNHQP